MVKQINWDSHNHSLATNKQIVPYLYKGKIFGNKKNQTTDRYHRMLNFKGLIPSEKRWKRMHGYLYEIQEKKKLW